MAKFCTSCGSPVEENLKFCPKCGAPQKPYRVNALKSYYKCSGLPPKFVYHEEVLWSHRLTGHNPQTEQ